MSWNVAITPSSYVFQLITPGTHVSALLASIFISEALVGLSIGWVLGKWGEGRYMAAGSAIYWTAYVINLYWRYRCSFQEFLFQPPAFQTLSGVLILSWAVVLFLPIGYAIRKHTLKQRAKNGQTAITNSNIPEGNLTNLMVVFGSRNICHRCIKDEGLWLTLKGDNNSYSERATRDELKAIFVKVSENLFLDSIILGL